MPFDANAKTFVPNVAAKAFVPNFGGGAPADAPPPPPRVTFFRYSLHVPPTGSVQKPGTSASASSPAAAGAGEGSTDANSTPKFTESAATAGGGDTAAEDASAHPTQSTAFTVPQMLAKSCLRPNSTGGPTMEALNEFAVNYFTSLFSRPDSSRLGFFASTELLSAPQYSTATPPANFDSLPGYLLPIILPSKPQSDNTRHLISAWQIMTSELQSIPVVKGVGHITRTWKQDDEGAPVVLHYFFVVLTEANAIPAEKIYALVDIARQVIALPRILPAVFDAYRLVAAVNLKGKGEVGEDGKEDEDVVVADSVVIQVPRTVDQLADVLGEQLLKVAEAQSQEVCSKSIVLVIPTSGGATSSSASSADDYSAASSSRSGGQLRFPSGLMPSDSATATLATPDLLRLVFRLCWDYLVMPCCLVAKEGDVQQIAQLHKKPIKWDSVSPLVSVLSCFATRHLKNPTDCATTMRLLSATVPSETQLTVVKQPDLTTVLPITGRTGTPFNVNNCLTPVEDLTSYLYIRTLIQQVSPHLDTARDYNGDTTKVKRLRASNIKDATNNVAREGYRLRRTCLGEQVIMVIDSLQNMYLIDAATKSFVVALPTWRNNNNIPMVWSGNLNAANCVLEATLVPSFRNEGSYKVIIEDVLLWNSNMMTESLLTQRLQEIDGTNLDEEHQWPAGSPNSIICLRSSYFPLDKGPQLLNTFVSEHPTQGLTFVPMKGTSQNQAQQPLGKKLPSYAWQLSDSCTTNFLVASLADVSEEANAGIPGSSQQKVNRVKVHTFNPDGFTSYNDEYVDYLVPTAPGVSQSSTVQCLLIREADGAHWWEVISEYQAFDRATVDSKARVDSLVHDPNLQADDVHWLCTAMNYLCMECGEVDESGADDTSVHKFYCRACWEKYGFGDCRSCNLRFTPGTVDQATGTFYCKNCWTQFMTPPNGGGAAQGGGPNNRAGPGGPPGQPQQPYDANKKVPLSNMPHSPTSPNAPDSETLAAIQKEGLTSHILSLAHKVLIDAAATKLSMSPTDVLELNCGCSANLKRWVEHGAQTYFGADISTTLLDEARAHSENILAHLAAQQEEGAAGSDAAAGPSSGGGTMLPHVEHLCGDVYHSDFWSTHIRKAHSAPFHTITCHQGLHSPIPGADAKTPKQSAGQLISGVSSSLVPNGIFMALILDAGTIHEFLISEHSESKTSGYHCPLFSIEHAQQPNHEFTVSLNLEGVEEKKENAAAEGGDVIKKTSKQRLQAADVSSTVIEVAKEHDLTPCTMEVFKSGNDADQDAPFLAEFLLGSQRAKDVGALLAGATEAEKKLLSFFRVLILKKGAAIAPLSEPTNK